MTKPLFTIPKKKKKRIWIYIYLNDNSDRPLYKLQRAVAYNIASDCYTVNYNGLSYEVRSDFSIKPVKHSIFLSDKLTGVI